MSFGMNANKSTLQPFTKLLLHIGSHMSDTEVSAVKLVLSIEPNTKAKALLTVNNAFDVLILMVNRGYITETDLSFLEDIFTNLFRKDLVSDIHTFINKTGGNHVTDTIPKTSAGNAEGPSASGFSGGNIQVEEATHYATDDEKAENIPTREGLELERMETVDESNANIDAEDVSIDSVDTDSNISDEEKLTAAIGSQPQSKMISTSLIISFEQIKQGFGVLQSASNAV